MLIEVTDIVFAVDSIPAIFAVTDEPFLVFTANAFAILGLRAMYFLLADLIHRFVYLKIGLALVLIWVGVKMLLKSTSSTSPPPISLAVIATIITVSIVLEPAGHPRSGPPGAARAGRATVPGRYRRGGRRRRARLGPPQHDEPVPSSPEVDAMTGTTAGSASEQRPTWTLLTNHGHVLLAVARSPDALVTGIAEQVGITTRATVTILNDLEDAGFLRRHRVGRRNHYTVDVHQHFRHPATAAHEVGGLLDIFAPGSAGTTAARGTDHAQPADGRAGA